MIDRDGSLVAQDAAARERALDVTASFLVQAPAGSGKTGLLIQRFLALLAHVDRPERIVAMTFTRKAAGEMRERIVEALEAASRDEAPPADAHRRRTFELARAALAQDRRLGWQLALHPSRLAIDTIDAIAAGYARQAPVTSGFGALPRYVDDATELYVEAARSALARAPESDPSWRALVAHDARAEAIVALLADLLSKRDQWLRELPPSGGRALRAALDATLAREIEAELFRAREVLAPHARELTPLLRYASAHLDGDAAAALERCAADGGLPPAQAQRLDDWIALADWLLVKGERRMRQQVDKRCGFPAPNGRPGAAQAKSEIEALLRRLAVASDTARALDTVRRLPPAHISDDAWSIVEALLGVLRDTASQLALTFVERGRIDFVEGALAAERALGDANAPTDLLLRLDASIAHLLIDEFQDTSVTQLALIERLTAGWTPGDGRTVFAVGDPMQSIYRFRAAEVRLFVEAQRRGRIAEVPIECLTLRRNFRSDARIVDWVNQAFPAILGDRSDPLRGIVAFTEATAAAAARDDADVTLDALASSSDEGRTVVARVQRALADGDASIAVLVRTRRHAESLLPALREAGIAYTAVELDAFGDAPVIRDLASLAHALVQPADRLAWLAVLRAPWCGLALADLMAVAATKPQPNGALVDALASPSTVPGLSDEGCARLERAGRALMPALAARGRASVAARVRGAWLALGGAACVADAVDLDTAERFFLLLAEHERAGDIDDWHAFETALERVRRGEPPPDARVLVMTLHKAKGLQFDTVIMPALASGARGSTRQLMRWRRREHGLLIAPGRAHGGDDDPICTYLARLAADEEAAELGRLLYVGCTRAKRRLHLTATLRTRPGDHGEPVWATPPSGTALARLWTFVADGLAPPRADGAAATTGRAAALARLPLAWRPPLPRAGLDSPRGFDVADEAPAFDWVRETARHVGVVVHRVLAQIARESIDAWSASRIDALAPALALALGREGVEAREMDDALAQTREALHAVVDDARGRWLFDPRHEDARSEWALAGVDADEIVHKTLDRTFVEHGVRWIVDFKTGRHEGGDVDAFLDRERERYAPTLETYARLVRALDPRPIRLALYHPRVRGWREWAFAG